MTREIYDLKMSVFIDKTITKDSLSNMFGVINMYIGSLEAIIEAQEIIIKDKTSIMEAMANPKTCDGCKYDTQFECTHWSAQQEDCCNRYPNLEDYYEPKAQYE